MDNRKDIQMDNDFFGTKEKAFIKDTNCGLTFGPVDTKETTILENLEKDRDNLIERLKHNMEAIVIMKASPKLNEVVKKLMRAGVYFG